MKPGFISSKSRIPEARISTDEAHAIARDTAGKKAYFAVFTADAAKGPLADNPARARMDAKRAERAARESYDKKHGLNLPLEDRAAPAPAPVSAPSPEAAIAERTGVLKAQLARAEADALESARAIDGILSSLGVDAADICDAKGEFDPDRLAAAVRAAKDNPLKAKARERAAAEAHLAGAPKRIASHLATISAEFRSEVATGVANTKANRARFADLTQQSSALADKPKLTGHALTKSALEASLERLNARRK